MGRRRHVAGRGARGRAARADRRLAARSRRHHPPQPGPAERVLPAGGRASPAFLGLIALALLALWLFQAVYTVQPDEVAVELIFGKPKDELSEPGLHFHWWPVETVEIVNTAEKLIDIGGGTRDPAMPA